MTVRRRGKTSPAARLLLETPDEPTQLEAEASLRTALHDPTLVLGLWDSRRATYVDGSGTPLALEVDGTRETTVIEYEGSPLAVLVHDATLRPEEPELFEETIATARVALEKDRSLRELRAAESRHRALLNVMPDLMFRIGRDGTYVDFKADPDELFAPDVVGRTVFDRLPRATADALMTCVLAALDDGGIQTLEYELDLQGEIHHYEGRVVASGEDEVVLIVRDFTERKRLENELRRERDLITTIINTAPSLICGSTLKAA